jgi:succinyl-CoA:acetate CoA-transferase
MNRLAEERWNGTLPRTTPKEAAESVSANATVLVSGFGSVGYPKTVPLALADDDRDLALTIVSGGSIGDEIDVTLVEADAIARRFPYQGRQAIRDAINEGTIAFHDRHIAGLSDEVQYGGLVDPDVAVVEAIAVGKDWLIPSTSIGLTPAYVESANRLIVEVNKAQPLSLQLLHDCYRLGPPPQRDPVPLTTAVEHIDTPRIEFDSSKLDAVVESDRRDAPYTFRDPTERDETIVENLVSFLNEEVNRSVVFDEKVHMQFGVGSLGNALLGALGDMDLDGRELFYFGEVIQDGLLGLLREGHVSGASATSLALSEAGQDELFDNIERYAETIILRPSDVSNNPAIIDRFGVIAVNSAVEVDIYGHANSTHLSGTHVVNGVGGSGDFNRNALVSITALPSTAADGDISRIVPMVSHTDHTEHDIDIVVTEHGVADLRGQSPRERAKTMVEQCTHPRYRDDLKAYLNRAQEHSGHITHDLDTAFTWEREH